MTNKLLDCIAFALNCIRYVLVACFAIVVFVYVSPIILLAAMGDAFAWAKKWSEGV